MSNHDKTGGEAFPRADVGYGGGPGMTLRDWFAGQVAIQALNGLRFTKALKRDPSDKDIAKGAAEFAYLMADAMIAERAKTGDGDA